MTSSTVISATVSSPSAPSRGRFFSPRFSRATPVFAFFSSPSSSSSLGSSLFNESRVSSDNSVLFQTPVRQSRSKNAGGGCHLKCARNVDVLTRCRSSRVKYLTEVLSVSPLLD